MLLQDYVKWRGPLFHRFLLAIVDDSASVRALAEYLLTDTLASKVHTPAVHLARAYLFCSDHYRWDLGWDHD